MRNANGTVKDDICTSRRWS